MIKKVITNLIRKIIEPAWQEIMKDYDKQQGVILKEMTQKITEKMFHS
jgi:hypothetical protein